jgi:hypothetical protein
MVSIFYHMHDSHVLESPLVKLPASASEPAGLGARSHAQYKPSARILIMCASSEGRWDMLSLLSPLARNYLNQRKSQGSREERFG